jgi:L-threonylcarbamoyladenylate synthase
VKTRLTRSPRVAADFIRKGEVAAFPTETVYGLGADVFNESAIAKVFAAKGRPADNPLIAHIASMGQLVQLASEIPDVALALIDEFFPGPLTLVLRKAASVPRIATAGLETVGVRMPRHDLALALIRESGTPLVAPSANLSGRPSPTTWQAVAADLDGRIACILKGNQTEVGLESTVVDCTTDSPMILRAGAVTLEDLRRIAPATMLSVEDKSTAPRSPGLAHQHYAPRANVRILADFDAVPRGTNSAFIGLRLPPPMLFRLTERCASIEDYARKLFNFFRECDAAGIETIYCQAVAREGLGLALMDRIERAARR